MKPLEERRTIMLVDCDVNQKTSNRITYHVLLGIAYSQSFKKVLHYFLIETEIGMQCLLGSHT